MLNRWRIFSLILTGIGWLVSGYLLLRGIGLSKSGALQTTDVCSVLFSAGCDSVLMSPSAWQLGVPLPGWGLLYFAVLGFLLVVTDTRTVRPVILVGAAGCGASLAMAGLLLFDPHQACPLCLAVHITNFLLFASLWKAFRKIGKADNTPDLKSTHLFTPALRWLTILSAVLGLSLQMAFSLSSRNRSNIDFETALAEYRSADYSDLLISSVDPVLGSDTAEVQMAIFSSFQCPGCRSFPRIAKQLHLDFPDRLQIAFKHYPLSKACNPAVASDMQPQSCPAAYAAQAAHLQGEFWPYHDNLFNTDLTAGDDVFLHIAREIGLDQSKFEKDLQSEEALSAVQADVALGNMRMVDATPSVFINGRRIPRFNYAVLKRLIRYELEAGDSAASESD